MHPPPTSTEQTWRKIDAFLKARTLIPVIGPGAITYGEEDHLLYPWLVNEVSRRLGIAPAADTLHHLVCAHLRNQGSIEDVCLELNDLLDSSAPAPGRLLHRLASLPQCLRFFTLGFDPLFQTALNAVRGGGRPVTTIWNFALDRAPTDLPAADSVGTLLGYLFGKVSPNSGFHLWDADAVEFVLRLQKQISAPGLNTLGNTLAENNFLFIGSRCSDWVVRFLVRTIRQQPLNVGTGRNFLIADADPPDQHDAVFFYDSLRRDISVVPGNPISFAHEFCDHALALETPLVAGKIPGLNFTVPLMEPSTPDGSIFISYAHHDAQAACKVVERLRAHGCLVWLDDERLVCGDHFENHLEDAVKRHCGFFVSLISRTTESRTEGYFHKERKWAAERSLSIHDTRPFYFPVVIDDAPAPLHHEPREFAKIDFERAPDGVISKAFAERLTALQQNLLAR